MPSKSPPQTPRPATCEDWDEDTQTTLPSSRTSANVTVKRSRPELAAGRFQEERRKDGRDSGYSSRTATVYGDEPGRRAKPNMPLKVETSFAERERRPYASEARPEPHRQSSSRPAAQKSEPTTAKRFYQHKTGECWICDKFGEHRDPLPEEYSRQSKEKVVPPSPKAARLPQTPTGQTPQTARPQPRTQETSSCRDGRPMSYHAGVTASEMFYQAGQRPNPFDHYTFQPPTPNAYYAPPTPIATPYTPTYHQTPFAATPQGSAYVDPQAGYFQSPTRQELPLSHQPRPSEPSRRYSTYGQYGPPVVEQPSLTSTSTPLVRITSDRGEVSDREYRPAHPAEKVTRHPSTRERSFRGDVYRDETHGRAAMPPPPLPRQSHVLYEHRPSHQRSTTDTSASSESHRRQLDAHGYERDGFDRTPVKPPSSPQKERRDQHPPSSYRGPANAHVSERPHPTKSYSDNDHKNSTEVARTIPAMLQPPMSRRNTTGSTERNEVEAEAYQRRHGGSGPDSSSHPLTEAALRRIPPSARSETNSSQKSRHSSSKGSSGGKTGKSNSGINVTIGKLKMTIGGDGGENSNISIQPRRDGTVNISVGGGKDGRGGKEYRSARGDPRGSGSVVSRGSKSSRGTRDSDKDSYFDKRSTSTRDEVAPARLSRASSVSYSSRVGARSSRDEDQKQMFYGA